MQVSIKNSLNCKEHQSLGYLRRQVKQMFEEDKVTMSKAAAKWCTLGFFNCPLTLLSWRLWLNMMFIIALIWQVQNSYCSGFQREWRGRNIKVQAGNIREACYRKERGRQQDLNRGCRGIKGQGLVWARLSVFTKTPI